MPDYLRVRQKGKPGHHITIRATQFDADAHELLDEDPLDRHGDPKRMTPKTTVNKAAEKKATTSGQQADTRKETD